MIELKIARRNKLIILVVILVGLWVTSFLFPELTIRRYILTRLHPITSFTAEITNKEKYDQTYGHMYDVNGYKDTITGDEISFFYLKKHGPFWTVSSAGSGP